MARVVWDEVNKFFGCSIVDYVSLASKWLCNKRHMHLNVVSSAVLWGIWNNRNNLVFNRKIWMNMKHVWSMILAYLRSWKGE